MTLTATAAGPDTRDELPREVLRCQHAPLVFADRTGKRRTFEVRRITAGERHCKQAGAMDWDEKVAVTNDSAILEYLRKKYPKEDLPAFSAAGDRSYCLLDPAQVRVGIVNAGGPAPGLCMVNDSITKRHFVLANSTPVIFGYHGGFKGLAENKKWQLVPTPRIKLPSPEAEVFSTDDHARDATTFLGSSRFNLRDLKNFGEVLAGIKRDKLDILYVVGGNGSQVAAQAVKKGLRGHSGPLGHELVIVGGPKTMDNDLLFADTTFGFQTTVDHAVDAVSVFHNTVECLDRVGMMQVFGAASGFVALNASYCSGVVDYPLVPEVVMQAGIWALAGANADRVIDDARFIGAEAALRDVRLTYEEVSLAGILLVMRHLCEVISYRHDDKRHALVVVAEGAKGLFAHSGASKELMPFAEMVSRLRNSLKARPTKKYGDVQVTAIEPTYLIRDNPPRSYDLALCKFVGKAMADAALAGYTDCLVTRWCGRYVLVPLELATALVNQLDPTDYFYRSMATRFKNPLDRDYVRTKWKDDLVAEFTRKSIALNIMSSIANSRASLLVALRAVVDEMPASDQKRLCVALELADRAHAGQKRKHGADYITHPLRVALMLHDEFGVTDSGQLAAAVLHDVLEDAPDRVSPDEIRAACGDEVLELVEVLTSPSEDEVPDKTERNRQKAAKVRSGPQKTWEIKLADRIDNLRDALKLDGEAGRRFRLRYCDESERFYAPIAQELAHPGILASFRATMLQIKQQIAADVGADAP